MQKKLLIFSLALACFLFLPLPKTKAADHYLCTYGNGSYYVITENVEQGMSK